MPLEIEDAVIEKLRSLTPEQQREVLDFMEDLTRERAVKQPSLRIWEEIAEISAQVPPEEWEKVPKDGSINVDHYLYGAPKKES